jgi:integrase
MSVETRRSGGRTRYVARWRQDGRQHLKTFDRKQDAEAFERERRREAALGAHGLPEPSPMRLDEWMRRWWGDESASWSPATRRTQASAIDKWIVPYIGGVRLRDLGHARVRRWRSEVRTAGCPATQANKAARILSAALGVAVREGLLPRNPVQGLQRVPVAVTRPRALPAADVEQIRAHMPTLRDVALLGLMAYCGLRPGEALALRWGDLGHVVVVDRAVSDGVIRQTKTNRRRTVEVPPPLQRDLDLLRPKVVDADALVIHGERGQVLDLNNWRSRVWDVAAKAAGVKSTPYDMRHSYATALINQGLPLPYITTAMGHASSTTTLDHYSHLIDDARGAEPIAMVDAVEAARADLEKRGVYPMCTHHPVRVLRAAV